MPADDQTGAAVSQNGVSQNGVSQNGVSQNGVPRNGSVRRPDRKWPLWARILTGVLLVPVCAAGLMAAENDFAGLGVWFDPLMIFVMVLTVAVVWATTGRSQR
jgi:hypothetical protein